MGMFKRRFLMMGLMVLLVVTMSSCSSEKEAAVADKVLSTAEAESEMTQTDETEADEAASDEKAKDEVANLVGGTHGNIATG